MTFANLSSVTLAWRQVFMFDRYGHRNFDESLTTTLPKECNGNTEVCEAIRPIVNPSVNTANNRLNGYTFDAAGNTTVDAEARQFTYDAENKQTEVRDLQNTVIGQYRYDGDGKRVKKVVPETGETTILVYDASGRSIAEYSTVVESIETAKVAYLTADHLGSPRINTDRDGNVTSRHDYHPFGEEIYTAQRTTGLGYDADTVRKQFTAYENDEEVSLKYAQYRYYNARIGRFTSVNPQIASASRVNPQTFNRFVYALNNPLSLSEPWGLKPVFLRMLDENGNLSQVMRTDDEDDGYQALLDSGWRIVEYDENGEFRYNSFGADGEDRTAILRADGTWGWAPSNMLSRVAVGSGIGLVAGAVAGTEELPGPGTVIGGLAGVLIGGIIAATNSGIVPETSSPAIPIPVSPPSGTPTSVTCRPCRTVSGKTVPVGTIGFRPLDNNPPTKKQHGIWGGHHNIYRAAQAPPGTPQPCRCFWVPIGAVSPPPPIGSIPIEDFIYPN